MSKRRTSKTKVEAIAKDPVAELIASDEVTKEFPNGFVWFACNQRWFNQYIVSPGATVTGKGYTIERTGTMVDIKDMEYLKELKDKVYCRIQGKHVTVSPIGVTSM